MRGVEGERGGIGNTAAESEWEESAETGLPQPSVRWSPVYGGTLAVQSLDPGWEAEKDPIPPKNSSAST